MTQTEDIGKTCTIDALAEIIFSNYMYNPEPVFERYMLKLFHLTETILTKMKENGKP